MNPRTIDFLLLEQDSSKFVRLRPIHLPSTSLYYKIGRIYPLVRFWTGLTTTLFYELLSKLRHKEIHKFLDAVPFLRKVRNVPTLCTGEFVKVDFSQTLRFLHVFFYVSI